MKKIVLMFMMIFTFTISYSSVILGNKGSKKNKTAKSDINTKIILPVDINCNSMYWSMYYNNLNQVVTGFRHCNESNQIVENFNLQACNDAVNNQFLNNQLLVQISYLFCLVLTYILPE